MPIRLNHENKCPVLSRPWYPQLVYIESGRSQEARKSFLIGCLHFAISITGSSLSCNAIYLCYLFVAFKYFNAFSVLHYCCATWNPPLVTWGYIFYSTLCYSDHDSCDILTESKTYCFTQWRNTTDKHLSHPVYSWQSLWDTKAQTTAQSRNITKKKRPCVLAFPPPPSALHQRWTGSGSFKAWHYNELGI